MARQRTELVGRARLQRALRDLKKAATNPAIVEDAAEEVQRLTRSRVHVDTGELKSETQILPPEGGFRHKGISTAVGWKNIRYAWMQEYGTKRIPANPALTTSLEETAKHFANRVRDQVRRAAR